ncbi:hypothetical protein QE429_000068 [Bacillus sp. SORGH_AS 510]|uniref:hypothetical protein n=1 Tax=Bacillus sp. SORGH_AS_0510 TaxID=3041771 RepID=UPI00277FC4E1|nr:hypothetical protein [Bacillus sp. SORGH_AS_0510]MDQ1143241.1 hypothetical protein [Bacillus sp. SORGH_AS_0510]
MNRYLKSVMGLMIGGATAGGWLLVDLLLPDPIGDYLLFILMAVVNMAIGWQVGRLLGKPRKIEKKHCPTLRERNETKLKLEY